MKHPFTWLPYAGLLLLASALVVRGCRTEGLDLPDFPVPPVVQLPSEILTVGTERIAGRVLGVDGEPLPESLVLIDLDGELAWDYCDTQGRFAIERLPASTLRMTVLAREYEASEYFVAAPEEDLLLELRKPLPPTPVLAEIAESPLEGEVTAAMSGRGWADYEVQFVPVDPPQTLGTPVPVATRLGADRRFAFESLIHGEYEVRILPPWAAGGSWPNLADPATSRFVHGPAKKRAEIRVRTGELAGRLLDTGGEFVEGAFVRVSPGGNRGRPWKPELSDTEGAFVVRDLPPGTYELRIDAGEAHYAERIEVFEGTSSEVDVPPLELRGDS